PAAVAERRGDPGAAREHRGASVAVDEAPAGGRRPGPAFGALRGAAVRRGRVGPSGAGDAPATGGGGGGPAGGGGTGGAGAARPLHPPRHASPLRVAEPPRRAG